MIEGNGEMVDRSYQDWCKDHYSEFESLDNDIYEKCQAEWQEVSKLLKSSAVKFLREDGADPKLTVNKLFFLKYSFKPVQIDLMKIVNALSGIADANTKCLAIGMGYNHNSELIIYVQGVRLKRKKN